MAKHERLLKIEQLRSKTRQKFKSKALNNKKFKSLSKENFKRLLHCAFNISEYVECGSAKGERVTAGALKATEALFDLIERNKDYAEGVILVTRLLTECFLASDPNQYAEVESDRSLDGARFEFENATIWKLI